MFCLCFRESPKFAQLYFFDPSATVRAEGRAGIFGLDANPRVLRILLRVLENVIVSSNSYYARFLTAVNVARYLQSKGLPLPEGDLIPLGPAERDPSAHRGRYNRPNNNDVTGIALNHDEASQSRQFVVSIAFDFKRMFVCFHFSIIPRDQCSVSLLQGCPFRTLTAISLDAGTRSRRRCANNSNYPRDV